MDVHLVGGTLTARRVLPDADRVPLPARVRIAEAAVARRSGTFPGFACCNSRACRRRYRSARTMGLRRPLPLLLQSRRMWPPDRSLGLLDRSATHNPQTIGLL